MMRNPGIADVRRSQLVGLVADGLLARREMGEANAAALAETLMQSWERVRICPACGSSVADRAGTVGG